MSRRNPLAASGLAALIVGVTLNWANALTIAVYTKDGTRSSYPEMRAFAKTVRQGLGLGIVPENDSLRYVVTEDSVFSAELSVPPRIWAYFWTDRALEFTPEFEMLGESVMFEDGEGGGALAKQGLKPDLPAENVKVFSTAFQEASMQSGILRVSYSLASAAKVSLEAYGINGQSFGSWHWNEAGSGEFSKSLSLAGAKGPFFLKWKTGNLQIIKKIRPGEKPSGKFQ
jgi:hypothetical protein